MPLIGCHDTLKLPGVTLAGLDDQYSCVPPSDLENEWSGWDSDPVPCGYRPRGPNLAAPTSCKMVASQVGRSSQAKTHSLAARGLWRFIQRQPSLDEPCA
jgi:hypothetical protein